MKLMDFMQSMIYDYESAAATLGEQLYNLKLLEEAKIKLAECEAKLETIPASLASAYSELHEAEYDIEHYCDYREARRRAYQRRESAGFEIQRIEIEKSVLEKEIERLKKQIPELELLVKDFSEKLIALNQEVLKNIDLYAIESKTQDLIKPNPKAPEKSEEEDESVPTSGQPGGE